MTEALVALDVAGHTDVGLKRQKNEDSYHFQIPQAGSPHLQRGALFVIADGMGGMGGGDVASQTAIKEVFQHYYASATPVSDQLALLMESLEAANVAVRDQARQMNRLRIGSTAAGLVLLPTNEALLFNVGDSRVYRIRQSVIELMTHDQSVLQGQIDGGLITEEEARLGRNVNVTAFIGQPTPIQPVLRQAPTELGDTFVICSDGLWDVLQPHEILDIVVHHSAEEASKKLIALVRQRGAPDNVTVIVVRLGPKPAGRHWLPWFGIGTALLLLIAAGAVYLAMGDDSADKVTPTVSTVTSAAIAALPETQNTDTPDAATAEPTHTASGLVILPTSTRTASPTWPTDVPTGTVTRTPTVTITASASPTRTLRPTALPTITPPDTPLPTRTLRPTATATRKASLTPTRTLGPAAAPIVPTNTLTPTRPPRATATPHPPTVTLNPSVISPTPTLTPSVTPTLSAAEQMLVWADREGVRLVKPATLYQFSASNPPEVREIAVRADAEVHLLSDEKRTEDALPGVILREVALINDREPETHGWMSQDDLETGVPSAPSVTPTTEDPVNLYYGDGTGWRVVGKVLPGEYAVILGISSQNRTWYKVERLDGIAGWVSASTVEVSGDPSQLELIAPPPIPVRPTVTPTPEEAEATPLPG